MFGFIAVAVLVAQAQTTQTSFEEFFEKFKSKRDQVHSLRATFIQRTVTPDEVETSRGTVSYARPKRLLFRYEEEPLVYAMDGNHIYEYDGEISQVQVFEIEERPETALMFLGFENNARELEEGYSIRIYSLPDDTTTAVELRPKDPDGEDAYFKKVTLFLRPQDYLPVRIEIENEEESHVYMTLEDIQVNPPLKAGDTQIFLPEGTDIIKNDDYIERVGAGGKYLPPPMASASEPATP